MGDNRSLLGAGTAGKWGLLKPEWDLGSWTLIPAQTTPPSPQTGLEETVSTGLGSYLARAFPGGSMRVCHLEESVSRLGRMWPSSVSVSCCMSRQKMA